MSTRKSDILRNVIALAVGAFATALLLGPLASEASAAPTIRLRRSGIDRFDFHGRVKLDPPSLGGPVDPVAAGFGIELQNELGTIYKATLLPGDLVSIPNHYYRFRDRSARDGNGIRSGLYRVTTRFRKYRDGWYYTVYVLAFADLSAATHPLMTVIFSQVDGTAALSADWLPTRSGWRLPLDRF
jgi:hypothetical protein